MDNPANKKNRELFLKLDQALQAFIFEINKKKLKDMVSDEWTIKDLLGHITYWHQYYAQQYKALSIGDKPYIHQSLVGKNEEAIKKTKHISQKKLIGNLLEANETLRTSILVKKVAKMKYVKSSQYSTNHFLEVVIAHINRHTQQARKAKSN